MPQTHTFPSGTALQEYLLKYVSPADLVLVPHRRLARQIWHRQRLANLKQGLSAWEPLPLITLPDWWTELYKNLWPPYILAPPLVRLALWRQAIEAGPPLEGVTPDLEWAQALDETHDLLLRHNLSLDAPGRDEPLLVGWRRDITRIYGELLREEGWLAPGEVPNYLLSALERGGMTLPARLLVVGLETPAPMERRWFEAVAEHVPVTWLFIQGNPGNLEQGYVFPDRDQEMAWAAARLLEWHHQDKLPLHRLAVTSPVMDRYAPRFQKVLRELLGPAAGEGGYAYNLSRGPSLGETPLWAAALLPLAFLAQGERREDLMALLLSPYYQGLTPFQGSFAAWDRLFRENRVAQGWQHLKAAVIPALRERQDLAGVVEELDRLWSPSAYARATGRQWAAWLEDAWQRLGFPGNLEGAEEQHLERLTALLGEFAAACGEDVLPAGGVLAWLSHGAREAVLPGPGVQEAGVQVLGWLEMRGLDFDRVICLGMTSAAFPGSARPLPLLSRAEKEEVLGGTQESQDRFAKELFENLLGTTPHLFLSRPALDNQEPQVGTPFYHRDWQEGLMPLLSRPHPAWLRAPGVRAALARPVAEEAPRELWGTLSLSLPAELRVTQVGTALGCRFRFVLEELLGIRELPEIETGLDPRERGGKVHQVLARFVEMAEYRLPPGDKAEALLREAARQVLNPETADPHWQAEWRRWFGDEDTPGLLLAWLDRERERVAQGWRWVGVEETFQGLSRPGWPFTLKGRLDRLDFHPEAGELIVWDYKTGEIPNSAQVFERLEEFQLPAYLWAVREGHTQADLKAAAVMSAGFIGLKSTREDHLKHEDFGGKKDRWDDVLTAWEEKVRGLGERLVAGDVRPAPHPAPKGRNRGACSYCPYPLICSYQEEAGDEEGES